MKHLRLRLCLIAVCAIGLHWLGTLHAAAPKPPSSDTKTKSAAAPAPAVKPAATNVYLRFEKQAAADTLQVAITSFTHEKTGVKVDLIGVIHIGDRAYFEALNKRFTQYDAVLFELVADPRDAQRPAAKPKGKEKPTHPISLIQRFMQESLALQFQLDIIDYTKPNFVHADMDPKTFAQRQNARGESMFSLMWKMMQSEMGRQRADQPSTEISPLELMRALLSPDRPLEMKRLLAGHMSEMEDTLSNLDGGDGTVIVNERNDLALKVLKKSMADGKKRLAIFYGAAHMPDMERKLTADFGFRRTGHEWLTAWHLTKPAPKSK